MVFLFFIVLLCVPVFASDVIFLTWINQKSSTEAELEMGCRFYGLDLKTLRINFETKGEDIFIIIRQNSPEAVIVTAEAMA